MVICLERGVDLHMAQLMPLPLTISCFSKILISFTFLILAHPGSPGKRAVKCACACVHTSVRVCVHVRMRAFVYLLCCCICILKPAMSCGHCTIGILDYFESVAKLPCSVTSRSNSRCRYRLTFAFSLGPKLGVDFQKREKSLQCCDAVCWAAGRASGL